jgi:hypothetical protein
MMPLRVELKPFERIVIGETVLINSGTRTSCSMAKRRSCAKRIP